MPSKPKKKYTRTKMDGVHVAKIKNRYIFRKNTGFDNNGYHHYLVFTDKFTGQNVAVETSHLYKKDPVRFQALYAGRGMKMTLPGMETPSLIMKKFHTGNAKGQEIDFAHRDVKVKARLSNSKAKKLFGFIRRNRKQKNATGNTH
jgi:hypothetical protein